MRVTHKSLFVVAVFVVTISALWFVRSQSDTNGSKVESNLIDPYKSGSWVSDVDLLEQRPELLEVSETELETIDLGSSPELIDDEIVNSTPENLNDLLPTWIVEGGEVFQDNREIEGQTVLRSRGRYQWENGSSLGIEITDVGLEANEALIKALGFDLDLADVEEEGGFKLTQDEEDMLMNQEYDYANKSGSLQILMSDRYLVEIKIEQMEEAVFQEILDTHIPFDELFQRVE
jgi:hypothetical protein